MTARIHWLLALLAAGVLATAAQTTALGVGTAHATECSVCEFPDDEGEVFP
jgi:hypothetical protein